MSRMTGRDDVPVPDDFRVVVSHSEAAIGLWRTIVRWLGKELDVWGTHALLLFYFPGQAEPVVVEANYRGVLFGKWDNAARADGYRIYRDVRTTERHARDAWFYCLGRRGVLYEFPLLFAIGFRVFRETFGLVRRAFGWGLSVVKGHGGVSEICSTLVNGMAQEVFGVRYVDRDDPTPDEIAKSQFLEFEEGMPEGHQGYAAAGPV